MNDHETINILTDGEEVAQMTKSRGWAIVSQRLGEKILDAQNISNVDGDTTEAKIINLEARKIATAMVFEWLQDVTGIVRGHEVSKEAMMDVADTGFIDRSLESSTRS